MVIFHSYVKLPEGIPCIKNMIKISQDLPGEDRQCHHLDGPDAGTALLRRWAVDVFLFWFCTHGNVKT